MRGSSWFRRSETDELIHIALSSQSVSTYLVISLDMVFG
jgi:hypothetical protein